MVIVNKDVIASKTTPILWTIINNKEVITSRHDNHCKQVTHLKLDS